MSNTSPRAIETSTSAGERARVLRFGILAVGEALASAPPPARRAELKAELRTLEAALTDELVADESSPAVLVLLDGGETRLVYGPETDARIVEVRDEALVATSPESAAELASEIRTLGFPEAGAVGSTVAFLGIF